MQASLVVCLAVAFAAAAGRTLERVEKGRYLTLWNQMVISADPDAP